MNGRKIKNKNLKERGEVDIGLIHVSDSHKYGKRKSIMSLKKSERTIA